MHLTSQNINNIIKNVIDIFSYKIKHQHIMLKVNYDNDIQDFFIDREKIKIVIINIIINAIQAMPNKGKLVISTYKNLEKEKVAIEISDTGQGISNSDIQNIFELFYTTKEDGIGLGLAIVKSIIERHNGEVKVKSDSNGTVFYIYLPNNLK